MIIKFKPNILSRVKLIKVDDDIYNLLTDRGYRLSYYRDEIVITTKRKGLRIPLWRLVRKCFNKFLKVEYRDKDKYNLQRDNLFLKRI